MIGLVQPDRLADAGNREGGEDVEARRGVRGSVVRKIDVVEQAVGVGDASRRGVEAC